jgi:hypothetical protein
MGGKNSTLSDIITEICRGQVHASRKERIRIIKIKIKIIIRNGAKTISLPNFGRLNKWVAACTL